MREIGQRYLNGLGAPKNPVKAWAWLSLAQQNGEAPTPNTASVTEIQLSSSELTEARQLQQKLGLTLADVARTLGAIAPSSRQ